MEPALWPVFIVAILAKRSAASNGLNQPSTASAYGTGWRPRFVRRPLRANCCRSKRAFPQGSSRLGEPQALLKNW